MPRLAVILLPEDGTELSNTDSLLLEGSASDPNHLESQLVVTWSVNGGRFAGEGPRRSGHQHLLAG